MQQLLGKPQIVEQEKFTIKAVLRSRQITIPNIKVPSLGSLYKENILVHLQNTDLTHFCPTYPWLGARQAHNLDSGTRYTIRSRNIGRSLPHGGGPIRPHPIIRQYYIRPTYSPSYCSKADDIDTEATVVRALAATDD